MGSGKRVPVTKRPVKKATRPLPLPVQELPPSAPTAMEPVRSKFLDSLLKGIQKIRESLKD